jgi:trehalose 6-phosphate synthase/trehalose 6-phosphate phosphatase
MLVGSHGHEFRYPYGSLVKRQPTSRQSEGLEMAREYCIARDLDMHIERKVASIALHTRGLSPQEALRMETDVASSWGRIAGAHGLDLRRFNGGLYLRCMGMAKGDALRTLLSFLPGDILGVNGDDDTMRTPFVPSGTRIGIKVGDPGRHTEARGSLPDIPSVQAFSRAGSSTP